MAPECPECGGVVAYDLTCHTYRQGGRWVACLPCDSAVEYVCARQYDDEPGECTWTYVDGLNRDSPRAEENARRRPVWLDGHVLMGEYGVISLSGVPHISEVPE